MHLGNQLISKIVCLVYTLLLLEVPEAVTDLMIDQLDNGVNVSWKVVII